MQFKFVLLCKIEVLVNFLTFKQVDKYIDTYVGSRCVNLWLWRLNFFSFFSESIVPARFEIFLRWLFQVYCCRSRSFPFFFFLLTILEIFLQILSFYIWKSWLDFDMNYL